MSEGLAMVIAEKVVQCLAHLRRQKKLTIGYKIKEQLLTETYKDKNGLEVIKDLVPITINKDSALFFDLEYEHRDTEPIPELEDNFEFVKLFKKLHEGTK